MGFRWLCTTPEGRNLRGYVNVSGRYKMDVRAMIADVEILSNHVL